MRKLLLLIAIVFATTLAKAQTITISSPNGGEVWAGCTTHPINWSSSGTSGFFTVEYSTNGGVAWTTLATNLAASTYSWTIPNTSSTNCLVRVFDYNTPSTVDQSNAVFTITAPLILTAPNGGEVWQVGGPTQNITWVATGTSATLTLEYSVNAGASWINISSSITASAGTYTWTIPNNPSVQCLVRIRDNVNACMTDNSDNLFTIQPGTPVITVTSPNTAVTWYAYQSYSITWTSNYLTNPNVMIEYSTDNGATWTTIIASTLASAGSYTWNPVPNTPTAQALVRISQVGTPSINDVSNVNFTISSPVINVTSPNTAVTWYVANSYPITWTSTTLSGPNAKIEYSTDNGATWTTIVASTANSGTYTWNPVPNTPSTTCLVRVSDPLNASFNDVSNVNFTIAPQSVTVNSPNGGESWNGCSSQTITWTKYGTTANTNLEYSIDGGTTWLPIASNVTGTSYTWTPLPNTPSTNCFVRATIVGIPTATDMNNAAFTITINNSVIVNTPNGGEVWQVGGPTQNITWAASGTSATVELHYSIDGGTTWTLITTASAAAGTYAWTIPNFPSTNCLVRVRDAANYCKYDVSNAVFTISPPTPYITVTTPNTALTWYVANSYAINWTSGYLTSSFVRIEYSIDNGATWILIVASTTNSGTYTWNPVPNTPSTQCLVKVSEFGTPSVFDVSNVNFTIAPQSVTLNTPNGGETYNGCSAQTISWTKYGTTANTMLEYSIDGGATWTTIVSSTTGTSYTWTPVPNTPSTNCLVRATIVGIPTATDVSNAAFTITPNTSIIVNTPNGGEVWVVGGPTQNVTWAASGTSATLNFHYSIDNGATWIFVTTVTASAGTYAWTIPNNPSTTCLVRLQDAANTCKFDVSDAVFTISPPIPYITVTTPNTALTWYVANSYAINWTSGYLTSSFVRIEYSIDNGATWILIVASTTNSGTYTWNPVPNTPSTQCLVRVSEFGTPSVFDVSNVNFTIAPQSVTLNTPNGGETYNGCSAQTISWTKYGTSANTNLDYSIDGGATWLTMATNVTGTSYTWTPVPNTPSTNCLVRATIVGIPTATDVSNAAFTITPNTSIIVNTPNGGEVWQVGGPTQNVTWAASGTSATLNFHYSIDNGATWIFVTTVTASAGTYAWTIPNNPSTTCLVRLQDAANTCKFDVSNAVFTISPPTPVITVTAPNTAVTWYSYQSYNITWTYAYLPSSNVKIEYSTDNGATWTTIISSTLASAGSYTWNPVPFTPSTQCLVRVSDASTPSVNDVSNVNFTISAPVITVTSPNTAVTWYVANSYPITWTSTTLSGPNAKIEYSTDGGTTWTTIVAATSNTGTYTWNPVPNTPSTTCLVRVSDPLNATFNDVSNVNFTIAPQSVTVNSPNGGENWQGCSSQTITWTKYGTTGNTMLEYSIDGGVTWTTIVSSTTGTSYTWFPVPNTPSTNCLVRATIVGIPTATDNSNFPFTISPNTAIIVNTPNGGEVWQVGGPTQNITWASSGTGPTLTIQYSTDNGATWNFVANVSSATTSYAWTIPNTPSTQCLVKIFDAGNVCKFDVSNAVFTISPPTPYITVTTPNTALTWYVANSYAINWTSGYLTSSFVRIDYSIDNGATWINIVPSTANSGTYTWNPVPNTPSTQCLVKVTEFGSSVSDVSNVNFTIAPQSVTVNSPNGGESWNGCSSQTITWTKYGTTANTMLEYSIDGGATWTTIVSSTTGTSYTWTPVPNTPSSNCLVRASIIGIPTATDVSNFPFTITPNTSIVVNTPNGGEVWQVGGPTQSVTWAASGTSATLNFYYSVDGGTTWIFVTTVSAAAGNYSWTIPNNPSTNCLVKLQDASNACKYDVSNAVFTISPPTPTITVTAPNTAVTLYVSNSYTITWTSAYLTSSFVKIDYSIDNGANWLPVVGSTTASTGSYNWNPIPNTPSTQCLVRVSDFGTPSIFDISNVNFTISPAITVTAPNGGENVGACTVTSINWQAGGCSGNYRLEYSINGGTSWTTIVASYAAAGTGACSYSWTLPTTSSANCLVRVTDVSAGVKTDQSNAVFTIYPAITVTQPNVGGTYLAGSVLNINWTSTGVSNFYNIDYSTDNGVTWINIVFNMNIVTGTYAWTIPSTPSTTCLVRVTDNVNTCKRDQSDVVFTITTTAPALTVTAPNGGENWPTCSTQNITWNATGCSGNFNIEYSTNSGSTWTTIVSSYAAPGTGAGSYSWTVPNTISATALIRVTDASVGTRTDISNSVFNMSGLPLVASGTATICNGSSTPLTASGTTSYSWAPAAGLSSTTVANPTASPATTTTYTVTGTTGGCTNTATVTVTVNPVPTVAVSPTSVTICTGSSTSLMASGGSTYSWAPSTGLSSTTAPTVTANPTSTTTYTVVGTTGGCTASAMTTVTVNPLPTVTASGSGTICVGGSQALSATGATTYLWTPGTSLSSTTVSNPTASPATTITYTVTGTTGGCTGTSTVFIAVNPLPNVTTSGNVNICAGSSATITASGATTYSWSPTTGVSNPSIANPSFSPTTTTTYTVTGTTAGCTNTTTVIVTVNPAPPVTASGTTTICAGQSTSLSASGATTYSWSPSTGLSSTTSPTPNASPSSTTTYTVVGTAAGCTASATVTVTVTPIPVVTVSGTTTICNGSSTTLTANGATTYVWTPSTGLSSATVANPTANPTATTTYTVVGSTGACTGSTTVTIVVNPIPTVSAIGTATICAGASTSLNAAGAVSYAWLPATGLSNPAIANPVATPAATTTYTVTGTSSGCTNTASVTITITPLPVITVSGGTGICAGGSTSLTASGATSYVWTPSTGLSSSTVANPTASPASTTTYTVAGTQGSCTGTTTVTVTVNTVPVVTVSGTTTICDGASTTLTATGATTYSWSPATGLSSTTIANPVANPTATTTYTVTGTTGGCTGTTTVTITVNPSPVTTASGAATICSGASTPLTAGGATTYLWTPSTGLSSATSATPTASPTTTTTYTVAGTTAGCSSTATVTITVNPTPVVSVSGTTSICTGGSTTLTASGATSYLWTPATGLSSDVIANPVATPAATTTYTVAGTTGSCTGTTTVTITVNPIPVVTASGTATVCAGVSTPLTASGATTYLWTPATGLSSATVANPTATPATTTTYTVTGTSLGCSSTATVTITVNPTPAASAGSPGSICSGGSYTLNASGGTTYSWAPATGLSSTTIANPVATPASTTTYTVTVGNGTCTATATVTVSVGTIPTANAGTDATIFCGGTTTLGASGGTSYSWSPSTGLSSTTIANPVANPTVTTTYTVTVSNGTCTATDSVTITVNGLTADAGPYTTICAGGSTTLSGSYTGSTVTYSWLSAQKFGSTGTEAGYGNFVDASGNQYITGSFTGTVTFGATSLTASGTDIYVVKLNSAGVVQWAVKGGGTGTDIGYAITADLSGNVYVTGYFSTTATIAGSSLTSGGSVDVFVAKYNSAGVGQWAVRAGATNSESGYGIVADASGVWVTGQFYQSAAFGSFSLFTSGSTDPDIFVAKYNTAGTCLWAQRAGGTTTGSDRGTGVGVDASGNAYITGYFVGASATFGSFSVSSTGGGTDMDAFIAKYNSTGTCQWVRKGGTSAFADASNAIATDAAGNSYITGQTSNTSAWGALTLVSAGAGDAFLAKYNSSGTEQWVRAAGGTAADAANGVCIDPASGNIFIAAKSAGGTFTIGTSSLTGFGTSSQTFIAEYSNSGTPILGFKSTSPSPGGDIPTGIGADNSGNIYIHGTFGTSGAATTGVFGPSTITTSGLGDAFIAKAGPSAVTTYAWTPSTGLSSTTIASPTASPTSTTTYTLTVNSGACSAMDTVTVAVVPAPVATAGGAATICSGTSTPLTASGGTTYSWSPATGLSSTTVANPTASPTTTTTYTVTVSNGGSCTSSATVTVTVTPSPTANAGTDQTIACGATTTLSASGGTTYSWSPATGLSSTTVANPTCTPPFTITYTVTVSNGSCTSTDAVTITTGSLVANAGPDVTICSPGSTTLAGSSTGGGGSYVNLATSYGFTQNVATYTAITGGTVWLNGASPSMDDVVSGSITIPTFNFNNINYNNIYISTNGFITFGPVAPTTTNYDPIGSTETYAGAVAGFATDMNKATSGTPEIRYQTIGTEFIVQFRDMGRYNASGTLDRLSWQIRLNTVGNTVKVVYQTPGLVGAATFDPEVGLRGPNNTFATNVHNRLVQSTTGPWVNSLQGVTNTSVCFIDASVPATVPANGTTFTWTPSVGGPTTYSWSPSTGLSSTTIANPVASPTSTTTYTLTATSGSCSSVDMVTVTVISAAGTSAGPDATICPGGSTTLAATGGGTYSWSPATGLSSTTIANPVASPTSTTTYTVTVSNGSCTYTDAVTVTVTPVVANAGSDVTICTGNSTTLSATGGTTYSWSPATGLSSTTIANPIASPTSTTSYTVTATNGSCTATDVVVVTVNPAPLANAGTDATICPGGNTTLNATGGGTYSWSPATGLSSTTIANPVASPSSTTNYTVTVTNGGCTATDVVTVTVNTVTANAGADVSLCSGGSTTLNGTGGTTYLWTPSTGLSSATVANPTASPTSTTTYTLIATTGGCSATDMVTVTVNSSPATPASISGPATVCEGSSQTYSVPVDPNITSYNWVLPSGWSGTSTTNTINVTVGASGGVIVVTASNACGSATPVVTSVTVNPLPSVAVSPFGVVCVSAAPMVLTNGTPAGGIYSGTGITGGTTFDPASAGAGLYPITYTYTDVNGCSNSATDNIQVDLCTGLATAANANTVSVYPNPFTSYTIVAIGAGIDLNGLEVHIYDMVGKEVMIFTDITSTELKVDRKDLRAGAYFMQLTNNGIEISQHKLIIE